MNVTLYASEAGPCTSPLDESQAPPAAAAASSSSSGAKAGGGGGGGGTNYIRGTCSKHHPRLVFEWARYEMALGWIKSCPQCRGWMLVCDVKDTFFQRPPFADLPLLRRRQESRPDVLVFEEAFPPPMGFDNNHCEFIMYDEKNAYQASCTRFDSTRFDTIRFDSIRFDTIRHDSTRCWLRACRSSASPISVPSSRHQSVDLLERHPSIHPSQGSRGER